MIRQAFYGWGGVLLICASISAILCNVPLVIKFENPSIRTKQGQARIVKRLPEDFEGKIVRLSVDGHIVRVVTDAGIFDLRMRFTDAIEEVLELDGVCTHRSHWVVLTEIANVGTVNGRSCLLLSNGDEVPVSRKYQPGL
jgi:DNA-binding LytR/AlgR family response regulator